MKRIVFALCALMFVGCEESSDWKESRKQEELSKQAMDQVGLPAIHNFQEKRTYKMILELRDSEIKTISYITDMNGRLHKICDSIGYGIPSATQYTSPMKLTHYKHLTLPQADPTGLYSPSSADGTWVLCLNRETKKISPVLVEPRLIVSPFALD